MINSGTKRRKWRLFVLLGLLTLVVAGVGLGTLYALSNRKPATPPAVPAGQAFFVSSGQLKEGYSQGINDQLQIVLHNIPGPTSGKSYYAWLLSDKGVTPQASLLLGYGRGCQ